MGALAPNELLQQWKQATITLEMAIGQLIQNQVKQQEQIDANNRALANVRADIDRLLGHATMPSGNKNKPKLSKRS